jgi:hypothetical protein
MRHPLKLRSSYLDVLGESSLGSWAAEEAITDVRCLLAGKARSHGSQASLCFEPHPGGPRPFRTPPGCEPEFTSSHLKFHDTCEGTGGLSGLLARHSNTPAPAAEPAHSLCAAAPGAVQTGSRVAAR